MKVDGSLVQRLAFNRFPGFFRQIDRNQFFPALGTFGRDSPNAEKDETMMNGSMQGRAMGIHCIRMLLIAALVALAEAALIKYLMK